MAGVEIEDVHNCIDAQLHKQGEAGEDTAHDDNPFMAQQSSDRPQVAVGSQIAEEEEVCMSVPQATNYLVTARLGLRMLMLKGMAFSYRSRQDNPLWPLEPWTLS